MRIHWKTEENNLYVAFLLFDCNMLECCYRRLLHYIFKDFCDSFQNVGFDVVVVYHFLVQMLSCIFHDDGNMKNYCKTPLTDTIHVLTP